MEIARLAIFGHTIKQHFFDTSDPARDLESPRLSIVWGFPNERYLLAYLTFFFKHAPYPKQCSATILLHRLRHKTLSSFWLHSSLHPDIKGPL